MSYEQCANGLKILLCVINTGALLVEIYTPVMGVTHSLIGPTAVLTIYILMGSQVLTSCLGHCGTKLFQMYSSIACICVELAFSTIVFKEMKVPQIKKGGTAHLILNGVLPIIMSIFLIADFLLILCTIRDEGSLKRNTISNFLITHRNKSRTNRSSEPRFRNNGKK